MSFVLLSLEIWMKLRMKAAMRHFALRSLYIKMCI